MNTVSEFTVPEKILLAAFQLEEQGQSPFSAEALIVASWQRFPRAFGLKGYGDHYPDSNRVLSSIMGERGLAKRGWLSKMGQKLYALSREGRQVVLRLQKAADEPEPTPSTAKISRDQEKFLLAQLASSAVRKFEEGRKDEMVFADASRFWGITDNDHGEGITARLDRFRGKLAELEKVIGTGSADLSNGRSISRDDTNLLTAVNEYLEDRFSRHLNLLRNRGAVRS
ncbi:MAG: hypothetical protein ACJ8FY_14760 [Gemmataceae bacterium]